MENLYGVPLPFRNTPSQPGCTIWACDHCEFSYYETTGAHSRGLTSLVEILEFHATRCPGISPPAAGPLVASVLRLTAYGGCDSKIRCFGCGGSAGSGLTVQAVPFDQRPRRVVQFCTDCADQITHFQCWRGDGTPCHESPAAKLALFRDGYKKCQELAAAHLEVLLSNPYGHAAADFVRALPIPEEAK